MRRFGRHPVAFRPDARELAIWDEGPSRIELFDLVTGREGEPIRCAGIIGLTAMCYTRDGAAIVADGGDQRVRLWRRRPPPSPVQAWDLPGVEAWPVSFSTDDRTLASGTADGLIWLRDARSLRISALLKGHGNLVSSLAFRPGGRSLASGSLARDAGVIL